MKQLLLTLLLSLGATTLWADDGFGYLTFVRTDGSETSLASSPLTITFSGGNLVASSSGETFTAPLSTMARMYFSKTPTGISTARNAGREAFGAEISGGRLRVSAPRGSVVRLYRADGSAVSPEARLEAGVYIVDIDGQTFKVLAK